MPSVKRYISFEALKSDSLVVKEDVASYVNPDQFPAAFIKLLREGRITSAQSEVNQRCSEIQEDDELKSE